MVQSFPIGLDKMSGLHIITNGLRQPVSIYEKENKYSIVEVNSETDFVAKLIDVYPDGTAINVAEGLLRTRYRKSRTR